MTFGASKDALIFLDDYKDKCSILKQIHSNKKAFYDKCAIWFNVVTVIASVILTITGFVNRDILYKIFMNKMDKEEALLYFDFAFNITVLIFLILTIINLIFRFQDKAFEHNRSVVLFSNMLREIKEIKTPLRRSSESIVNEKMAFIDFKYGSIIDSIPAHSDEDFFKAKEDYYKKRKRSEEIDNKYKKS